MLPRMKRDDLDLHEELGAGEMSLDRRPRGEVGSERGPIGLVHLFEPADVGEEDGGFHDILEAAPSLRQLALDVREGVLGLGFESRRRGPGLRVGPDLAGHEHERAGDDGTREGKRSRFRRIDSFDHGLATR